MRPTVEMLLMRRLLLGPEILLVRGGSLIVRGSVSLSELTLTDNPVVELVGPGAVCSEP